MPQLIVDIGSSPSQGDGDPLRIAFAKVNQNFAELYSFGGNAVQSVNSLQGDVALGVADIPGAASIDLVLSLLNIVTTVPVSSRGTAGDKPGMVAYDSTYLYYCSQDYDGVADIWHRIANDTTTW